MSTVNFTDFIPVERPSGDAFFIGYRGLYEERYSFSGVKASVIESDGIGNTKSFKTLIPTGIDKMGILFPTQFDNEPVVTASMQKIGAQDYYSSTIEEIYNTGFYVSFSDIVLETGFYLNVIAHKV